MDNQGIIRLDRAGRLITKHAMSWVRYLQAPIEDVWSEVSTREGLEKWWVTPPSVFDLRVGGTFDHHWTNTITAFEEYAYIDFDEPAGSYTGTGGMRFELLTVGPRETMFRFLDTFGPDVVGSELVEGTPTVFDEQLAGPGTIWPAVAAGWHGAIDQLERRFNPGVPSHSYEELCMFYHYFLDDQFRLLDMVRRQRSLGDV